MIDSWVNAMIRASWQGGLALLAAWIICAGFGRIGPGVKCWVWRLGYLKFVTALLLMGSVGLPLLPAKPTVVHSQAIIKEEKKQALAPAAEMNAATAQRVEISRTDLPASGGVEVVSSGAAVLKTPEPAKTVVSESPAVERAAKPDFTPKTTPISLRSMALPAIFGFWAMGVLVCATRLIRVWIRTRAICRAAAAVEDQGIHQTLERLGKGLGLRRIPKLLVSEAVSGPLLAGIFRPAILLPPGLISESNSEPLRLALTHELAHVRRRDIVWNLIQTVVESLFFFHPLIWIARRQPRHWQELACDGMTLESARVTAADYGRAILGIIERQRWEPASLAGVGVAESMNSLKKRLVAMTSLRPITGRGMIFAVMMVFVLALAGIPSWRLVARAAAPAKVEAAEDPLATGTMTVKVLDSEDKPIEDASVSSRFLTGRNAQAMTSKEGLAIIRLNEAAKSIVIDAKAHGMVPTTWEWRQSKTPGKAPNQVTIKMDAETMIGGIVTDENGKPVTDATVVLRVSKKYPESGQSVDISRESARTDGNGKWTYTGVPENYDDIELGLWSFSHLGQRSFFPMEICMDKAGLKAGTHKMTMPMATPVHIRIVNADGNPVSNATVEYGKEMRGGGNSIPSAVANGDGRVELGIVPGVGATLTVLARGYTPLQKRISVDTTAMDLKFELEPGRPLSGKVVDSDGKPIPGASVTIVSWNETRPFDNLRLMTDQDGTFVWNDAPADEVTVSVYKTGFANEDHARLKAGELNQITMSGPTTFSGKVVDAQTGKPIDEFAIIEGNLINSSVSWRRDQSSRPESQGKNGSFDRSFTDAQTGWAIRVEAQGYLPADSDLIEKDGKRHEFTFKLTKGSPVSGAVVDADGKAVNQAVVLMYFKGSTVAIVNNRPENNNFQLNVTTGADGKFQFGPQKDPYLLAVFADEGYAQVMREDFEKSPNIKLMKWARIEGELLNGTKPVAKGIVMVDYRGLPHDGEYYRVYHRANADENGKFVLDRVMANPLSISRQVYVTENTMTSVGTQIITPKPGETAHVRVGGTGRPLVGRVVVTPDSEKSGYKIDSLRYSTKVSYPRRLTTPAEVLNGTAEERAKATEAWRQSDAWKAYQEALNTYRESHKTYTLAMNPEGQFRAEEAQSGTYALEVIYRAKTTLVNGRTAIQLRSEQIGTFTIPEIPGGLSQEPLDIGTFKIDTLLVVKPGDMAPAFSVKTLEGKNIKLEDYRGRNVALIFWSSDDTDCEQTMAKLNSVWETYSADPKFAMIGMNYDDNAKTAAEYVKKQAIGWMQANIDTEESNLALKYGVESLPSIWLIGPDGKIVAKEARIETLKDTIGRMIKP